MEESQIIEIVNGRVFIDGNETVDPTLIGYAILDYAESMEDDSFKLTLKDQDVFVQSSIQK